MQETWNTIEEASGYEVSTQGRVRNKKTGRILNPQASSGSGYKQVNIKVDSTKKFEKRYIHRLVAQSFLENPENKKEVNHIDGNKLNNMLSNLEWVSTSENQKKRHQLENTRTSNRAIGRFSLEGELLEAYNSIIEAAHCMNVKRGAIDNALAKRTKTSCGYIWNFLDQEIVQ